MINTEATTSATAPKSPPTTFQIQAATGQMKLDKKVVQVRAVRGATGRGVQFSILNVGKGYLRFDSNPFSFSGTDGSEFGIVSGRVRDIPPGKRATFSVALT